MNIKIAAICDSELRGRIPKDTETKLGVLVNYEIQITLDLN